MKDVKPPFRQLRQQGFSLIELSIVVAIIGILAALAFPLYQDYVRRAYVTEALSLGGGAKTDLISYWTAHGNWPANNSSAGMAQPVDISGVAVKSVTIKPNGLIEIAFNQRLNNSTMLMQNVDPGSGSMSWACVAGANFDPKLLPVGC